jgi:hypothetical protein
MWAYYQINVGQWGGYYRLMWSRKLACYRARAFSLSSRYTYWLDCAESRNEAPTCNALYERLLYAAAEAIRRQLSAQRRHISAHRRICSSPAPMRSQSSAHRSHTSAQTAQVRVCKSEPRIMKFALVWHISAQSSSNRMCAASACFPPI